MAKRKRADRRAGGVFAGVLGLLVVAVVGFAASPVVAADIKPIELKWANFQTKEADSIPPLMDWLKAIETKSNGALKPKMYFVGEIAETKDLVPLCRTGSIQVISTPPVYYTGMFPLNSVLQQYYPLKGLKESEWVKLYFLEHAS